MARRRFFVDQIRKGQAEITGENAHHLTRVLRVEAGQTFEISDSEHVWLASVETVRKDLVTFQVLEEMPAGPPLPDVTLYLALIKFDKFEWAVEKATELGVRRIVPVEAARSGRGLFDGSRGRTERWTRIAREASEQSRRVRAPVVERAVKFAEALKDGAAHRMFLDERPGAPMLIRALQPAAGDAISVLTGPEGGWTDAERESCAEAGWSGASLGPTVLRAETAVCAALAVILEVAATIE
jgi:16S rRNA (uracil1498-N3)-methyltransferase